jgi:hypothetical protein
MKEAVRRKSSISIFSTLCLGKKKHTGRRANLKEEDEVRERDKLPRDDEECCINSAFSVPPGACGCCQVSDLRRGTTATAHETAWTWSLNSQPNLRELNDGVAAVWMVNSREEEEEGRRQKTKLGSKELAMMLVIWWAAMVAKNWILAASLQCNRREEERGR